MYILPEYVRNIINTLENNCHEAYVVGGSVRDMLLGKTPNDYDITTSCLPGGICDLFEKTIETGIKHGTVTIVADGNNVEVTTYRQDGEYINHRSPKDVNFVSNLEADLSRRDFTINAMAYNEKDGVIDLFGGKSDLKNKIIRTVGNADCRFKEDALRILRAVRFAARLDFNIEQNTLNGIYNNVNLLKDISSERIFSELIQILTTDNPQYISLICNGGGFKHIGIKNIATPALLSRLNNNKNLRYYAFCKLCDVDCESLCKALKTDNSLKKYCSNLEYAEYISKKPNKVQLKQILRKLSYGELNDYLNYIAIFYQADISNCETYLKEIVQNDEAYLIKHLAVDGSYLLELGFRENAIGEILEKLLYEVIKDNSLNTKERLTEILKKM